MWKDPIVEEVRIIRDEYARRFDYSLEAIYNDLKEQEAKSGLEFVSLPSRRIESNMHKDSTTELNLDLTH